jgi:multiple antibiotic resistance protein
MLWSDIPAVVKAAFLVVAALFPIVNPLGSAAIFLNMVGPLDSQLNRLLSQKIAIYSFFILLVSMLCGVEILSFFGISIYSVQIGWALLNRPGGGPTAASKVDVHTVMGNAFYPYTLPITVGPGSISVAITLGAHLMPTLDRRSILSPLVLLASIVGIALVCLIVYFCYVYAQKAERILGDTGTQILMRMSSFIVLCIGIQIICSGIRAYLATVKLL